jgi:hypothetical protein
MKLKSKTHGYLDYLVGVLLIAAPWIFDFYRGGAESWVPIALGGLTIIYSLFTDYEMGAIRSIPFRAHLTLDVLSGIFLAASPWLFNFADYVYLPHLIVGILEIVAVAMTSRHTSIETHGDDKRHYNTSVGNNPTWSH